MMANITPTRRDTRSKKMAFLEALSVHGTVMHAARVGGIHRDTHYYWLQKDPTYRDRMKQAIAAYCAAYLECIRRRTQEIMDSRGRRWR